MLEEVSEFDDPSAVDCKLTKCEQVVAERTAAIQAGDFTKVARIDAREEDCRSGRLIIESSLRLMPRHLKPTSVVRVVTLCSRSIWYT